ncbi:hypothetical protein CfE428DRAFT_5691 [Chthoniobacter flavus Ellin428]|uniref:Uncharacterized protein n=1 Tax=Chthoniobacter flavus Ellin428 TaxID=497964 RepID=B4D9X4_9BACT|nr:hypothetical protein [Chthoniobacter flavus]EDY16728.1 hypothetical protein CfE428DRAFT_5691 [Chthoniobacter flavus Ellin428]TCO87845.1 hypothetical protein EV701_120144 [Chthoniobacter flavus]
MSILKWFERKLFTGEVVQDYGNLRDERTGVARLRTSILLCRRKGKLQLVVRSVGTAPLGASAQYAMIDVTPQTLQRLGEIVSDAKTQLEKEHVA